MPHSREKGETQARPQVAAFAKKDAVEVRTVHAAPTVKTVVETKEVAKQENLGQIVALEKAQAATEASLASQSVALGAKDASIQQLEGDMQAL